MNCIGTPEVLQVSLVTVGAAIVMPLERLSLKCRKTKTKTKIISPTSHKDKDYPVKQSRPRVITCRRRKARENVCERVTVGFDWSRKWRETIPITIRCNVKPKQMRTPLDNHQFKTALVSNKCCTSTFFNCMMRITRLHILYRE